jgi:hypothetical protein
MILYDLYCSKFELNGSQTVTFCVIFKFLPMCNAIVGAGAVGAGAGATLRYGSGSDQKKRLLAAPTPQHCFFVLFSVPIHKIHCIQSF